MSHYTRPIAISKKIRAQGVKGPKYTIWNGSNEEIKNMTFKAEEIVMDINNHDFIPRVLPHYLKWMSLYGKTFTYWFGRTPRICILDSNQVKQILSNRTGIYPKVDPHPLSVLLGKGLVLSNGDQWARHRQVVNPAFHMDKLKMMTKSMAKCAQSMVEKWTEIITKAETESNQPVEMEVSSHFLEMTADVISHTAFGSNYMKGKEVFLAQKEQQMLLFKFLLKVPFPGYKYLPTKDNLYKRKLDKTVNDMLMQIINERFEKKECGYGNDLLGLMLEACMQGGEENRLSMEELIDESKTFFFAGHETTSHLLTWTMFLLGTNKEWQEKLREEVIRECGHDVPTGDVLNKLKLMNMVLLEALRLYGPVVNLRRQALQDLELGDIKVPKGTVLAIPVAILHRDKELWGPDADKFSPVRFENGVNKAAKHPNALLAFSIGPRSCIGQNFAMLEAKIVVSLILQRFSFNISPNYVHAPIELITLQPKFGLQMNIKRLE
ncbi:hypothetical protein LUZ61_001858 [Rhynchospora tenuis]|uniref:Cytochrome P450 n=1 Tax=Rhynchospora tenuis TaxID=198213 RepID=A0AAD5ZHZ9_9POAL|nr:hypothetical protein LUZ61_001858 [Rhynchospora tenuis]